MSTVKWPRSFPMKAYLIYLSIFVATCEDLGKLPVFPEYQQSKSLCFDQESESETCVEKCITETQSWIKSHEDEFSIPAGWHNSSTVPSITVPELLCRDESTIHLAWQRTDVSDDSSLQPPVVFLIEQRSRTDVWRCLRTSDRAAVTSGNLQANTEYKFKVRAIGGQIGDEKESEWISTLKKDFIPGAVENVTVTPHLTQGNFRAHVTWEPAIDRTCSYDVDLVWITDSGQSAVHPKFIKNIDTVFEVELSKDLEYDKSYSVYLRGKSQDKKRESPNNEHRFVTLSCLKTNNFNTSVCPPTQPIGLQVIVEQLPEFELYNLIVKWDPPEFEPASYLVQLHNFNATLNETAPGNATQVRFESASMADVVTVTAINSVGSGPIAFVARSSDNYEVAAADNSPQAGEYNSVLVVSTITLTILILVAVSTVIIYHRYNKLKRFEERCRYFESLDKKQLIVTAGMTSALAKPAIVVEDPWEVPPDRLLLGDVLGEGAFGVVRKGLLQGLHRGELPLIEVAVKMLKDEASLEEIRQFHQEIEMMKSVGRHSHLVSIIGCCTQSTRELLITEFCALGDLQHFLRREYSKLAENKSCPTSGHVTYAQLALEANSSSSTVSIRNDSKTTLVINQMYEIENDGVSEPAQKNIPLTSNDLLSFARQTTMGMEYLARNRVVHRDLAARNILLSSNKTIKISDFGLSRDVYEQNVYRKKCNGKLPIKWMAIESLLYQIYTTQSDVWSFGILLWEIVTLGGNPYPTMQTDRVFKLLLAGYRMECPNNCSAELYEIMMSCWEAKAKDRPTFAQLHARFDTLVEGSIHDQYLNLDPWTIIPGTPGTSSSVDGDSK